MTQTSAGQVPGPHTDASSTWWPHGVDLVAELPGLLARLEPRRGPIHRLSYNIGEWSATARTFDNRGHRVRLDGYHYMRPHTVDVLGVDGYRLHLRVVPADLDGESAEQRWESEGGAEPGGVSPRGRSGLR